MPIGDVVNLETLANILGCKTPTLPLKYLGLPLGAKMVAWLLEKSEYSMKHF